MRSELCCVERVCTTKCSNARSTQNWNFTNSLYIPYLPCPSFPLFPLFFPCFLSVSPFFSKDFRGSVGMKNPRFSGGFLAFFQKKNKERKDRVVNLLLTN